MDGQHGSEERGQEEQPQGHGEESTVRGGRGAWEGPRRPADSSMQGGLGASSYYGVSGVRSRIYKGPKPLTPLLGIVVIIELSTNLTRRGLVQSLIYGGKSVRGHDSSLPATAQGGATCPPPWKHTSLDSSRAH